MSRIEEVYLTEVVGTESVSAVPKEILRGVAGNIEFPATRKEVEILMNNQNSHKDMIGMMQLFKWMKANSVQKITR